MAGSASTTICRRKCPVFPLRRNFTPFPKPGGLLRSFISVSIPVRSTRWRSFPHSLVNWSVSISGSARAKRLDDEGETTLCVNDHVRLRGIASSAHKDQVNGWTPLEWFIDRYRIVQDKQSGIVNDRNGWFEDPWDLANALQRVTRLSVETTRIVEGLPEPFDNRADAVSGEIGG